MTTVLQGHSSSALFSSYCWSAVFPVRATRSAFFLFVAGSQELMRCNDGVFRGKSAHSHFDGKYKLDFFFTVKTKN